MTKTLIIRSTDDGLAIIQHKEGRVKDTAVETTLATFGRGNLQLAMFYVSLDVVFNVAMPDQFEMDVNEADAATVARTLKMRSPHTAVERLMLTGIGQTVIA